MTRGGTDAAVKALEIAEGECGRQRRCQRKGGVRVKSEDGGGGEWLAPICTSLLCMTHHTLEMPVDHQSSSPTVIQLMDTKQQVMRVKHRAVCIK